MHPPLWQQYHHGFSILSNGEYVKIAIWPPTENKQTSPMNNNPEDFRKFHLNLNIIFVETISKVVSVSLNKKDGLVCELLPSQVEFFEVSVVGVSRLVWGWEQIRLKMFPNFRGQMQDSRSIISRNSIFTSTSLKLVWRVYSLRGTTSGFEHKLSNGSWQFQSLTSGPKKTKLRWLKVNPERIVRIPFRDLSYLLILLILSYLFCLHHGRSWNIGQGPKFDHD